MVQNDLFLDRPGPSAGVNALVALRRTRRIAHSVLVFMVTTFLLTFWVTPTPTPVMLIRAMAEAGMIGALADWFAVSALFRHPFGIPIPHTALLPRNQTRAARNVGRFFEEHFLASDQLSARIRDIQPSRHIATWLSTPDNARLIAREIVSLLEALKDQQISKRPMVRLREWLRAQVLQFSADDALARGVADAVKTGIHGKAINEVLALVRDAIDRRREVALALVQDNSRWWIAKPIDRRAANVIVNAVLSLIDDLMDDGSQLRSEFEDAFSRLIDRMQAEGVLTRSVTETRHNLVQGKAFDDAFRALLKTLDHKLKDNLDSRNEKLIAAIALLIKEMVTTTLSDPVLQDSLDEKLAELTGHIVGEIRPQIAGYVTDVIAGWEPKELVSRFEQELGADLQYIRINGAILGSLIGGLLFGAEALMS